jgi:hypothetical protein
VRARLRFLLTALFALVAIHSARAEEILSIAGPWWFQINGPKLTGHPTTLPSIDFTDTIDLPGSTESNKKGAEQLPGWNGQLTRLYRFDGPAWYRRVVEIPPEWRNKRISLFLERTKYSQLWLDSEFIAEGTLFCSPQEFTLGNVSPGKHELTLCIDNTRLPLDVDAHQWSDNTQTNWNGIIGRIELHATDPVWLDAAEAFPSAVNRSVNVRVRIGATQAGHGTVYARVNGPGVNNAVRSVEVTWGNSGTSAELEIPLGSAAALWDEFHPNLMRLTVSLAAGIYGDQRKLTFGLRDFAADGHQFTINGRTTFLRGKHEGCVFPLTGYPPMDVDGWLKHFGVCKQYGINQIRCHTFVPPEAAFDAADQLGMYLQPELPFWGDFDDHVKSVMEPEARRILECYGSHPSFVMFTMGNENRGSRDVITSLIADLRKLDNRHLYAQGSNAFLWDPQFPSGDDFLISARTKADSDGPLMNIRGSFADIDSRDGYVQFGPANTMTDYSDAIAGFHRPIVGHEVGQYTVYPDFREIPQYTGVTRANNLEHFRDRLKSAGMLDQADDFFRASGALAAICYCQDIEAALRTDGFGGFQLLDLQDYPGQGTALVGMLNAFMEPKGIISPEQWRQFCAPIVLLGEFDKYTWTTDENFHAEIKVAHYGETDLPNSTLTWRLTNQSRTTLASGKLGPIDLQQGGLRSLGSIDVPLSISDAPGELSLELSLDNTDIHTSYPLWIYPPKVDIYVPPSITLARSLDSKALNALSKGRRVLLIADEKHPYVHTPGGGFATDFWCWPMFHNKPGTMGILCDPGNSALKDFPTESHSNWQWFDIAQKSQPLILDSFPANYRPDVQTIDNLERCHRLGLVFEAQVGPGSLLVCTSDLISMEEKPAPRQLLADLIHYAASDRFSPQTQVDLPRLKELLMTRLLMDGTPTASSFDPGWQNYKPSRAADANDYTQWTANKNDRHPWWQFAFNAPTNLNGMEIVWSDDKPGWSYTVQMSSDLSHWQTASDQSHNAFTNGVQRLELKAAGTRAVKINITESPAGTRAGIREVWFY